MSDVTLPLSIAGKKELIKVQREIEHIGEQLIQNKVTKDQIGKGKPLPGISDLTNDFLYANKIELNQSNIEEVIESLQKVRDESPMLRVALAVEPEREVTTKIVGWFRKEVNPTLLVQFGIQPSIAGGCVVQTPGHRYDMSLRKHILGSQDKFRAVIDEKIFKSAAQDVEKQQAAEQAAPQPEAVQVAVAEKPEEVAQ